MLLLNVVGFFIWLMLQAVVSSNFVTRPQSNGKNESEDNFSIQETTFFDKQQAATVISSKETPASPDAPSNSKFNSYNIFIGISGTALLFLLLLFTKGIQWYRELKSLLRENRSDDSSSDGSLQNHRAGENSVQVEYELWESSRNLKTVSGLVSAFVVMKLKRENSIELRTASSYRHSLRRHLTNRNKFTTNDALPSYNDIIKSYQADPEPPSYVDAKNIPGTSLKDT